MTQQIWGYEAHLHARTNFKWGWVKGGKNLVLFALRWTVLELSWKIKKNIYMDMKKNSKETFLKETFSKETFSRHDCNDQWLEWQNIFSFSPPKMWMTNDQWPPWPKERDIKRDIFVGDKNERDMTVSGHFGVGHQGRDILVVTQHRFNVQTFPCTCRHTILCTLTNICTHTYRGRQKQMQTLQTNAWKTIL